MRPPVLRASFVRPDELVVDNFAGGGGASTGIEEALGRPVDLAINHSPEAIAMHKANHPETRHYCENIWEVDPRQACGFRPVGLAWFSPDCTHFSRAKGGVPLSKDIRGLAWVVIRWAREVRPRIIILENVEEFQTWGPLAEDGRPDRGRAGETFREWLAALTDLGYSVAFRSLVAADYGAPTTRRRLFLVARCDGVEAAWPEPTHGEGRGQEWIPAAAIIDWSLPCPSIFERSKPLAEATLRRIAEGIRRYVVESADPFIITYYGEKHPNEFRGCGIDECLRTQTTENRHALVVPHILTNTSGHAPRRVGDPLATVTTGNHHYVVSSAMTRRCNPHVRRRGELPLDDLMMPAVISHYGQSVGREIESPLPTVTGGGGGHHGLLAAHITKFHNRSVGSSCDEPLHTITSGCGSRRPAGAPHAMGLVSAFLTKFYGTARAGSPCTAPVPTVTASAWGGHMAEVRAFLVKYYGTGGQWQGLRSPLHVVTDKARFGLVTVAGQEYQIADIGMRMLQPHELFAAQGFPENYQIAPEFNGKRLSKSAQVSLAGNSVPPPPARALVAENARAV